MVMVDVLEKQSEEHRFQQGGLSLLILLSSLAIQM